MRALLLTLLAGLSLALGACGGSEGERVIEDARVKAREVRDELEQEAERAEKRIRRRVEEILEDFRKAVPTARPGTPVPTARGRTKPDAIEAFLTEVLKSVDAYWTKTLKANGIPEPRVSYVWVPPGRSARSGCNAVADDEAAFYCPTDDTIYIGRELAAELYAGIARGFPGQEAGYGRAVGDFGVAYIVAHEYGHNVQAELGFFRLGRENGSKPFELQADCMAGLWGNSVYRAGKLEPGDVEEAMSTAEAVGDFDFDNVNHHGTPEERRAAWTTGYKTGDPSVCRAFVPGA